VELGVLGPVEFGSAGRCSTPGTLGAARFSQYCCWISMSCQPRSRWPPRRDSMLNNDRVALTHVGGGTTTTLGMDRGTSPAIAALSGGGWVTASQIAFPSSIIPCSATTASALIWLTLRKFTVGYRQLQRRLLT
jgi:hypothetical protein